VVAETAAADLVDALGLAGAFPIVEASFADAPAAIAEIQPAALVLADAAPRRDRGAAQALIRKIETLGGPFMPVLARAEDACEIAVPFALPVAPQEPASRLIGRLRSALRVRALHATVLRRAGAEQPAITRAF